MNALRSVATSHPILFAVGLAVAWFVLLLVLTGVTSSALRRPYGEATSSTIARLAVTACVLLVWRLGWLEVCGVARLGRWAINGSCGSACRWACSALRCCSERRILACRRHNMDR